MALDWLSREIDDKEVVDAILVLAAVKTAHTTNPVFVAKTVAGLLDGIATQCGGALLARVEHAENSDTYQIICKNLVAPGCAEAVVAIVYHDDSGKAILSWE